MYKIVSIVFCFLLLFSSCSSIEKIEGADKAETYYLRGDAYLKDGMYEDALKRFNLVKNKFPYSKYAVDAELKIADTYYAKGDYMEASKFYSIFSELHPRESRRDYALYRSGMSVYKMLPASVARDYTFSDKALDNFKSVMDNYPNSLYFKEALEKYTEINTKLAEKEIYIANFYKKKKKYLAASKRYINVLNKYTGLGFEEKMYYELIKCYQKLKDNNSMLFYANILLREYSNGQYAEQVKKMKEAL